MSHNESVDVEGPESARGQRQVRQLITLRRRKKHGIHVIRHTAEREAITRTFHDMAEDPRLSAVLSIGGLLEAQASLRTTGSEAGHSHII